jgi:hypothetical protein
VRRLVIAFALGFAAVAVFALAALTALALVADANDWSSFELAVGPATLLEVERTPAATTTTYGPGIALVALAGGALNAAGAAILSRRL